MQCPWIWTDKQPSQLQHNKRRLLLLKRLLIYAKRSKVHISFVFQRYCLVILENITQIWIRHHLYTQTEANLSDNIHTWRDYFLKVFIFKTRALPWCRTPWSKTNFLGRNRDMHSAESHRGFKVWQIPTTVYLSSRIRHYIIGRLVSCAQKILNSP